MRAIEYSWTGDRDVLTLVDRPVPDPGPGQVLVGVRRSGVNPTDRKSRHGSSFGGRGSVVDPPQAPGPAEASFDFGACLGIPFLTAADHVIDYPRQDVVAEVRKLAPRGVRAEQAHRAVEDSVVGKVLIDVAD